MAVRATRKAKVPGRTRTPRKAATAKKSAGRKVPAKSAKSNSAAKGAKKTTAAKSAKAGAAGAIDATAHEFLLEQNEALKAELERAQARIAELEELNRNVVNRIDWVIDSLQGAVKR